MRIERQEVSLQLTKGQLSLILRALEKGESLHPTDVEIIAQRVREAVRAHDVKNEIEI